MLTEKRTEKGIIPMENADLIGAYFHLVALHG